MNFDQWLAAAGYDVEALKKPENDRQRRHLEMAWKAETAPPPPPPAPPPEPPKPTPYDEKMKAIEAENERIEAIRTATAAAAEDHIGNTDKIRDIKELCEAAVKDKRVDPREFRLQLLRLDREVGPMVMAPKRAAMTPEVVEAAVCIAGGLENIEEHYSEPTLTAARREWRNGLGLHGVILHAAHRNGYRGFDVKSNWHAAVKAGF